MALDMGDLLPRYEWALKWLEQSSQMWKMVEGWLGTLWAILTLYARIKADQTKYSHNKRDHLVALEDQTRRFAEVDSTTSLHEIRGESEAAEALLSLGQGQYEAPSEPGHPCKATADTQAVDTHQLDGPFDVSQECVFDAYPLLASQDLPASIMGELAVDWSSLTMHSG